MCEKEPNDEEFDAVMAKLKELGLTPSVIREVVATTPKATPNPRETGKKAGEVSPEQ